MTNKKKTPTAVGEVEYENVQTHSSLHETVECHSCGQEVLQDDCKRMFVGDLYKPHKRHKGINYGNKYVEIHLEKGHTSEWLCPSYHGDPAVRLPTNLTLWERLKYVLSSEI